MRVRVLHRQVIPIMLSAALPWLSACQAGGSGTRAVSLEEAKKITAAFKGSAFVAPPRTITDIMKLLDEHKSTNWEAILEARARADQAPPATTDQRVLAEFYFERAQDAVLISRLRQAEANYSRALEIMRRAGIDEPGSLSSLSQYRTLRHMAAQISGGNFKKSIQLLEEALNQPGISKGARMATYASLAMRLSQAGELDKAADELAGAKSYVPDSYNFRDGGSHLRAKNLRAEGRLLTAEGKYTSGEQVLRRALDEEMSGDVDPDTPAYFQTAGIQQLKGRSNTHSYLARNLKLQGRLAEAEVEARRALEAYVRRFGRYSIFTALSLTPLAEILAEQGRFRDAVNLAQATVAIYDRIGAAPGSFQRAKARQVLGESLAARREWAGALAEFETIKQDLSGEGELFNRIFVGFNFALALVKTGRAEEALSLIHPLHDYKLKQLGKGHYDVAELGGMLGMIYAETGQTEKAVVQFSEAIPILLSRSLQSDTEGTTRSSRIQRRKEILESYIELLSEIRGTPLEQRTGINAVREAFRLADVARGQSVQRALTAVGARAAARDPELADLVRREQDTQKQLSALYGLLANVSSLASDEQDPKIVQSLRGRIGPLKAAHATLTQEIQRRFPSYADLIDPKPTTMDQARTSLRSREALIAIFVGEDHTYVWAVPHRGKAAFAEVPLGREQITAAVAALRRALSPSARTLGDIPDFDLAVAHKLYKALLEPVKEGWRDARDLLIVPHRPLDQLPFSVLVTEPTELSRESGALFARYKEVPWLARTHTVTVWPSVTSLVTLRALPPGSPGRRAFVGFGDPWFSEAHAAEQPTERIALAIRGLPIRLRSLPNTQDLDSALPAQLPRLPDTAEEVRSMARAMKADVARDVFVGKKANEQVVKTMDLGSYRVVAFATHGLVPGDLNGLTQPALALSSPRVAGVKGDGLLTMGEILGLKLDADWVVLSACNTGAGQGAGAEAVSGLGRAFFYAGTRAVLVSNWPVETTSAKALTTDLFWRQAQEVTLGRAAALRQAMLALIDGPGHVDEQGRTVFSYAHPIFWAPFSLVGDGGGVAVPRA